VPPIYQRAFADGKTVGLVLAGLSGIGALVVLVFGFLKKVK
jgi:hypothetical protein